MAAAYATLIAGEFLTEQPGVYCLYYDATLFNRHKHKNTSPHPDLFDSLDHCFESCHVIVWANLSYIGLDAAHELDTVLQRRFAAGLRNIVSGWNPPAVLATKDNSVANLANPYPLLHERAGDARLVYRVALTEKA